MSSEQDARYAALHLHLSIWQFTIDMKDNEYLIDVMALVGFTIVQLQRVEYALSESWLLYARLENTEYVFEGDIFEIGKINSKKMLGGFLKDIKSAGQFKAPFNKRFEKFVSNRNRLIHQIFREKKNAELGNNRNLRQLHRFISNLLSEAFYFEKVFDCYLGVSYEALAATKQIEFTNINLLKKIMSEKREKGDLNTLNQVTKKSRTSLSSRSLACRGSSG